MPLAGATTEHTEGHGNRRCGVQTRNGRSGMVHSLSRGSPGGAYSVKLRVFRGQVPGFFVFGAVLFRPIGANPRSCSFSCVSWSTLQGSASD